MMKEYKKPEISVVVIDNHDIIMVSSGNDLMSGSFNSTSGVVGSTVFNDQWTSGVFNEQ